MTEGIDWNSFFEMKISPHPDAHQFDTKLEDKRHCFMCRINFSSVLGLKLHAAQFHRKQCWLCGFCIKSNPHHTMRQHMNSHYKNRHGFDLLYSQYWVVKDDVDDIPCPICSKTLDNSKDDFPVHMMEAHASCCPLCFIKMKSAGFINHHIKTAHGLDYHFIPGKNTVSEAKKRKQIDISETWNCPKCCKELSSKEILQCHMEIVHDFKRTEPKITVTSSSVPIKSEESSEDNTILKCSEPEYFQAFIL